MSPFPRTWSRALTDAFIEQILKSFLASSFPFFRNSSSRAYFERCETLILFRIFGLTYVDGINLLSWKMEHI